MEVLTVKERLPYYMTYPMPLVYDDERMERRDFEYMKSMYPMEVKMILPYVEAECDRMAYAGSVIYDEYPDQLQVRMMCNRVYADLKRQNLTGDIEMQGNGDDDRLKTLVQILLFQELYQRRRQHRRDRRRYY